MLEIDRLAQEEFGVPQSVLMDNAGKCVADSVLRDSENIKNEHIAVLCGKGNNGGDGFVSARYLIEMGAGSVTVFLASRDIKPGAALQNFKLLSEITACVQDIDCFWRRPAEITVLIDAVFGVGFKGSIPRSLQDVFLAANALTNIKKYAVDIPSGLDADTGMADKYCFMAGKTVTFGLAKSGFYLNHGPRVSGAITVADIGFPKELLDRYAL